MAKFFGGIIYTNQVHCEDCNIGKLCTTDKQAILWWKLHNKKCKNPKKHTLGNIEVEYILIK